MGVRRYSVWVGGSTGAKYFDTAREAGKFYRDIQSGAIRAGTLGKEPARGGFVTRLETMGHTGIGFGN